ncbi:MAG TPA: DUF2975 domain-containing protein [Sphingomonas sp.]|nr:DUF2975 domain-containing protein [Sphingomonas sp.]
MKKRWLEHLLSLGIGLVALGVGVGAAFFLVALVNGEPMQTTLPLAFAGAAAHPVTLADSGQAVGTMIADHGSLTVRAGGALYLLGQGLDIAITGALMLVILYRLRRLVAAIGDGRPFAADNIRSLRITGWSLIALNLWMWLRMLVLPLMLIPELRLGGGWTLLPAIARAAPGVQAARIDAHLPVWLLVVGAIVLVLAEAFRQGGALRDENEAFV